MGYTIDMSSCDCCGGSSNSSSSSADDACNDRGICSFEWNGSAWVQISDNCASDGTPSPTPGCTWESCICAVEPDDSTPGDFVGEIRHACCLCTENCPGPPPP